MEPTPPKSFPNSKLSADVEPFVPKYFQEYTPQEEAADEGQQPMMPESMYYSMPIHYQDMSTPNYYSPYQHCLMPYPPLYAPHLDTFHQMHPGIHEKSYNSSHWNNKQGFQKHKPRKERAMKPQNSRSSDQTEMISDKNNHPSQKKDKEAHKASSSTNKKKNNENLKYPKERHPQSFPTSSIKPTAEAFSKEQGQNVRFDKRNQKQQSISKKYNFNKLEEKDVNKLSDKESNSCSTNPPPNCDNSNKKVLTKQENKLEPNFKVNDDSNHFNKLAKNDSKEMDCKPSQIKPKYLRSSIESCQSETSLSSGIDKLASNLNKLSLYSTVLKSSSGKRVIEEKQTHNSQVKTTIAWPTLRTYKSKLEIPKSFVTKNSGIDRNKPLEINLAELLKVKSSKKKREPRVIAIKSGLNKRPLNFLDSAAPVRRGKERERPKAKRPSAIKKIILLEKELKKKCREDLIKDSQTAEQVAELKVPDVIPHPEESSPIIETQEHPSDFESNRECAKQILHTRKYRDYCTNIICPELNQTVFDLLGQLVRYQDNMFQRDPVKARMRRRVVCGLREIKKHVKLHKLKAIIIASDVEKIDSKGGLTDTLKQIEVLAQEKGVETVYALQRSALGKACFKKVPSSCVGIFNYDGADVLYKKMLSQVALKSKEYDSTVEFLETLITPDIREHIVNRNSSPPYYQWLSKTRTAIMPQVKVYIDNKNFEEEFND